MNIVLRGNMQFQLYPLVQLLTLLFALVNGSLGSNISMEFTEKPKYAEYLVGTEVVFEWRYLSQPPDSVEQIQFGFSLPYKDVAVLVKYISSQEIRRNPNNSSLIKRISMVEDKPASFKITNLTLNDTGSYFCVIRASRDFYNVGNVDYVKLTVVDLLIDPNRTTNVVESWNGHKIHLMCAVKLANPESEVRFTWTQDNSSKLIGKQVDWKTESQMTMITQGANGFLPVICTARTAASTQQCNITIKRLHKPAPPQNVSVHKLPSNDTDCAVYNLITWDPPLTDGGTPITGYSVEYRHPVFNRLWVNRSLSHATEHVICMIQDSGHPRELNVDIRGVNKIGRGARSAVKQVLFVSVPSTPLNLSTRLERNEERPFQVVITWNPPDQNGGSPIAQYILEYKSPASSWKDVRVKETNSTQVVITKGKRQIELFYEVRVKAGNTIGFGAPSTVVNATFAEKPGAPVDLAKHSFFYDDRDQPSVKVDWNPPKDDGGIEVTHYIVEYKTVKRKWPSATKEEVKTPYFSWQVKISETYTVCVRASNRVGTGKPSNVVTVRFTEQDAKNLARSQGLRLSLSSSILIGLFSIWFSLFRL